MKVLIHSAIADTRPRLPLFYQMSLINQRSVFNYCLCLIYFQEMSPTLYCQCSKPTVSRKLKEYIFARSIGGQGHLCIGIQIWIDIKVNIITGSWCSVGRTRAWPEWPIRSYIPKSTTSAPIKFAPCQWRRGNQYLRCFHHPCHWLH